MKKETKRNYFIFVFILIVLVFFISFTSANIFSDFWNKITGKAVFSEDSSVENLKETEGSEEVSEESNEEVLFKSSKEDFFDEKNINQSQGQISLFLKLTKQVYKVGEQIRLI